MNKSLLSDFRRNKLAKAEKREAITVAIVLAVAIFLSCFLN
jgi:hypothetical protein